MLNVLGQFLLTLKFARKTSFQKSIVLGTQANINIINMNERMRYMCSMFVLTFFQRIFKFKFYFFPTNFSLLFEFKP